ncbi:IS110 family transposase [Streptomyces sp. UG1]|uniref:IS110 family transposase n=1 Tax=Streptomyces sp. UG1 TaxID=3417652 RepID=UPI003CF17147
MDTHRDTHVAAVLSVMRIVLATDEFPATAAGYRDLLKWARKLGAVRRAGVEGTGSFGASLSRYLLAQGIDVFDVNWMDRADRRRRGKSDPLDAQNARMYKLTKVSAIKARTQASNQLAGRLAGVGNAELFRTCARFTDVGSREEAGEESVLQATRITLSRGMSCPAAARRGGDRTGHGRH